MTPQDVLRSSIEAHNDTFETLLKLIPPRYYLVKEDTSVPSKYQKHSKNKKAPKQAVKEASKKARREKLNPANQKSTLDIQREIALEQERKALDPDRNGKSKRKAPPTSEGDDSEEDVSDAVVVDDRKGAEDVDKIVPMPQTESIAVLRDKLHARIAALRRPGGQNDEPGDKDELLEERRRQRAALREKRRKETKERKRTEAKSKEDKGKAKDKDKELKSKPASMKNQLLVPDIPETSASSVNYDSPLTNVAFSAVAGSTSKRAIQLKTASNPSQALTQLTSRKGKLAALPEEKRKTVQDWERWAKAEARIDGVKIKDSEAQLQKAIKRKEKEKARSKNKWEERKEKVVASIAARQKKRTDNIAMRNERRNGKKKGGSGKSRPGFEGKSFTKNKGKFSGKRR